MKPYLDDGDVTLYLGDCLEVMRELPAESVDAVVTDPPYGLGFMGKAWDGPAGMLGQISRGHEQRGAYAYGGTHSRGYADNDPRLFGAWCEAWAIEALRVAKPGAHLLAFGGTRTFHRLTCAIEDAGWEIRDCLSWLYGSGFPKSLNVALAVDRATASTERLAWLDAEPDDRGEEPPADPRVAEWTGFGTALKPAWEPVVVARKPLAGTVAANVLTHGTGAINVDGCRVGFASEADEAESKTKNRHADFGTEAGGNAVYGDYSMVERKNYDPPGRWPANLVLDKRAAEMLDEAVGERPGASSNSTGKTAAFTTPESFGTMPGYGDTGGPSRFFYTAKASTAERDGTTHPTVKPRDLMRWLVRLVTPPGGLVLDPFGGSGTTGLAARDEGFRCVLIEREEDYAAQAAHRLRQLSLLSLTD